MNILYCAYGKAGSLIFDKLILNINNNDSIFCVTYDTSENINLLEKLRYNKTRYSLLPITEKGLVDEINDFSPDIIISLYYRHLISESILNLADMGGINLHPSLLPKYRGTFSCPWAIINGEKVTGITYHYMNEKFDDGNIIFQKSVNISNNDTAYTLYNKLINIAVSNFDKVYDLVLTKRYKGSPQNGQSTYFPRQVPYGGFIDENWSLDKIERFIRAMNWPNRPYAKLAYNDKEIEIKNMEQYLSIIKQ
jgi:UDP-4-amino-4-deoxy-L-arabinose formyltransferase/UDP-glucuronic acid dehydrogenase (UDP-4-keto-hexauronic acid decarboxylating)